MARAENVLNQYDAPDRREQAANEEGDAGGLVRYGEDRGFGCREGTNLFIFE